MKILFLSPSFYPSIGGVERHVWEISKHLVQKGHTVSVLTEYKKDQYIDPNYNYQSRTLSDKKKGISKKTDKSTLFEYNKLDQIDIYYFKFGKTGFLKKFRIWKKIWDARALFKDFDVVHCHDVFIWYLPLRFFFPLKKIYTTFHGYEGFPVKKKDMFIRKVSEKLSHGNICIGKFIQKWYGTKPGYISYGGINPIKKQNKSNFSLSAIFIGRLDEQTNILEYSKAIEYIREKLPKFRFTVLGDGKYRDQVEKIAHVQGFILNPEKEFIHHNFAFVSRYLSILEALYYKRLIIAYFDNPIKRDYLKMTPFAKFIICVSSPEALAKAVNHYIESPKESLPLIDAGYSWVQKQTWDRVTDLYLTMWGKK